MVDRGVVGDEVDDDAQAALLGLVREGDEIAERAEARVDRVEIGDVVAVVAVGRGVEGQEPDAGGAEILDMVEPVGEPLEIADAVAVRIHEGLDVEAVDDGVLVPEIDHGLPRAMELAMRAAGLGANGPCRSAQFQHGGACAGRRGRRCHGLRFLLPGGGAGAWGPDPPGEGREERVSAPAAVLACPLRPPSLRSAPEVRAGSPRKGGGNLASGDCV